MIALRPRRLRRNEVVRALVREHRVNVEQLVQPLFVVERDADAGPVEAMPGIERLSLAGAVAEARALWELGIKSVLLFGIPASKNATASSSYDPDGIVQRTIRAIKSALPEMLVHRRSVRLRIHRSRALRDPRRCGSTSRTTPPSSCSRGSR